MTIAMTNRSFPHATTPSWIWPLSPALLCSCLAVTPARAAGLLDFDQGWTGANVCVAADVGCVDNVQPTSVTLVGYNAVNSQLLYVSPPVPPQDPGFTNFSFDYAFDPMFNQSAFYNFANIKVPLDSTGGSASTVILTGILGPGQTIGFGVANSNNSFTAELVITDFSYSRATSSVPGPLPLLGVGAAFGWFRRLRVVYRAGQYEQLKIKK